MKPAVEFARELDTLDDPSDVVVLIEQRDREVVEAFAEWLDLTGDTRGRRRMVDRFFDRELSAPPAAKPCATCKGSRVATQRSEISPNVYTFPCPDCAGREGER